MGPTMIYRWNLGYIYDLHFNFAVFISDLPVNFGGLSTIYRAIFAICMPILGVDVRFTGYVSWVHIYYDILGNLVFLRSTGEILGVYLGSTGQFGDLSTICGWILWFTYGADVNFVGSICDLQVDLRSVYDLQINFGRFICDIQGYFGDMHANFRGWCTICMSSLGGEGLCTTYWGILGFICDPQVNFWGLSAM